MSYLKRLTLKNVEGHKNSVLEFSPNVNFITGSSHVGKSSIFRALNWVFTNRAPKGGLVPWDNPKATVHVICEFADGTVIERKKGQGINCYVVNGNVLKAVGSSVPEEVLEALKITEINFQPQHAAYFLLNDPPSKITAQFNELANFEFFDELIGETARYLREVRSEKKLISEQIEEEIAVISSLKEVDLAHKQFELIEEMFEELQETGKKASELNEAVEEISNIQTAIDELDGTELALAELQNLISKATTLAEVGEELAGLKRLVNKTETISQELSSLEYSSEALAEINDLLQIIDELENTKTSFVELRRMIRRVSTIMADLDDITECLQLSEIISDFVQLYDEYSIIEGKIEEIGNLERQIKLVSDQLDQYRQKVEEMLQEGCPFMEHCPLIRAK